MKDIQPFSIIASEPFRNLLRELHPKYNAPNRDTFSNQILPAWYDAEKEKLVLQLQKVPFIALTADHWTSVGSDHYLTVTAHFVEKWELKTKVLETKAVYTSQTGEAIAAEIGFLFGNV